MLPTESPGFHAFVRLEPCDANVSRTVLKGLGAGNRSQLLSKLVAGIEKIKSQLK